MLVIAGRITDYGASSTRVSGSGRRGDQFHQGGGPCAGGPAWVSAQIRRLERELGHEIFHRSGRSVRLTDAGAVILPLARSALSAVTEIGVVADQLRGVLRGQVAIGMMTSCHRTSSLGCWRRFMTSIPGSTSG